MWLCVSGKLLKSVKKEMEESYLSRIEQPKFTKEAEQSKLRILDLNIIESEIREEVHAVYYTGDVVLSFDHGRLKPICRLIRTKKII